MLKAAMLGCSALAVAACGAEVNGTVYDREWRAVADAEVILTNRATCSGESATGANGSYRFKDVAPGKYSIAVR